MSAWTLRRLPADAIAEALQSERFEIKRDGVAVGELRFERKSFRRGGEWCARLPNDPTAYPPGGCAIILRGPTRETVLEQVKTIGAEALDRRAQYLKGCADPANLPSG
jgi:hypothetical protein